MMMSLATPKSVATRFNVSPGRTLYVAYVVYAATIGPSGLTSYGSAALGVTSGAGGGTVAAGSRVEASVWVSLGVAAVAAVLPPVGAPLVSAPRVVVASVAGCPGFVG